MTAVYIFKAYTKASVIGRDTKHCCIICVNYCGFPVRLVRVKLYYRSPKSNRVVARSSQLQCKKSLQLARELCQKLPVVFAALSLCVFMCICKVFAFVYCRS